MPIGIGGDSKLTIVIDAQNKAKKAMESVGKDLNTLSGKMKAHKASFIKMAAAGAAAMGALTVGAAFAVKEAAKAEGSYNKFNTVFGEHKEDMLDFVKDLRKEMPTATHDIVRLAADLQDLLVPLGLSREKATEMSKGFLDVANKIAAFNDVEPTEVLEAIKSGLAGSSEPLKRFGVNALETALETRALKDELLEEGQAFKDLEPEVKMQIRSQALLAQIIDNSSDAISGFEKNNDSFIRRQQGLNASITETKEALGKALLPMIDKILKKVLPFVESIKDWTSKHEKLSPILVIAGIALAGLVMLIGTLGLILPGLIVLFGALSLSMLPIAAVVLAIITVVGLLIAVGWTLYKNWNDVVYLVKLRFKEWKDSIVSVWTSIKDFFKSIWDGIKEIVGKAIDWLMDKIQPFIDAFEKVKSGVIWVKEKTVGTVSKAKSWLKESLGFQHGGVVPGAIGAPVPALVHGGETIIPAGRGIGGITINITGNTFMADQEGAEAIGDLIIERLKTQMRFMT